MMVIPYSILKPLPISMAIFLILAPCVSGQQSPVTKVWKLRKVEFSGLQRFNHNQLLPFAGLKHGESVDVAALSTAADRLRMTGFFKSVGYRYQYTDDRLDITFQVEELGWSIPVVFDNLVWFADEEIISAVGKVVPTFDGHAPKSGNVLTSIARAIEQLLRERNIEGQVEYIPSYEPSGEDKDHIISVKGIKLPICSVQFPGAVAVKEGDLISVSKSLFNTDYSRSFLVEYTHTSLVPFYRERGHLRARFRSPQARPGQTADCRSGVSVMMQVEEGPPYFWDRAEWKGNEFFSITELDSILNMKSGELANGLKIDNALKSVRAAYGKKGYITARLADSASFDDARRAVVYQITVSEGSQYRMGNIGFVGFSEDEEKRLKENWKLKTGDIYDSSYLDEYSKILTSKIIKPGSKPLEYSIRIMPDRENLTVDVTYTLK